MRWGLVRGKCMTCGVTYLAPLVLLVLNAVPQFVDVVVLTSTVLAAIRGHQSGVDSLD